MVFEYKLILLNIKIKGFLVCCNLDKVLYLVWVIFLEIINKIKLVWFIIFFVIFLWILFVILFNFGVFIKFIFIIFCWWELIKILEVYLIECGYWVILLRGFVFNIFLFNKVFKMVDLLWLIRLKIVIWIIFWLSLLIFDFNKFNWVLIVDDNLGLVVFCEVFCYKEYLFKVFCKFVLVCF